MRLGQCSSPICVSLRHFWFLKKDSRGSVFNINLGPVIKIETLLKDLTPFKLAKKGHDV